jgi:uncharacterized Zn-binding protein involved in type VI secretion
MIIRTHIAMCDKCGFSADIGGYSVITSVEAARAKGWAVARNRRTCYCPDCAASARIAGCGGKHQKKPPV